MHLYVFLHKHSVIRTRDYLWKYNASVFAITVILGICHVSALALFYITAQPTANVQSPKPRVQ